MKMKYIRQLLSNDVASVLMEGHGIPNKHLDYPGLSISYWISKEHFLGSDWEAVQEATEKGMYLNKLLH